MISRLTLCLALAGPVCLSPLSSLKAAGQEGTDRAEPPNVINAAKMMTPVNGPLSPTAADGNNGTATSEGSNGTATAVTTVEQSAPAQNMLSAALESSILRGNVEKTERPSPFLTGQIEVVPKGTQIDLTLTHNINSEFTQKGDEIWARISRDVVGSNGRVMPGGWFAHGFVTEAQGRKRGGRDGYVIVQFDKIISPDGAFDADFDATLSTKDSTIKTVAKEVFTDSRYTATGALGGALLSLQFTGIAGAIATHGISVGVGAGIGGGIGLFGALKRFGSVESLYSGDDMKLTVVEPIVLPAFNRTAYTSNQPAPSLKNMNISVIRHKFTKDPYGDKHSRLLEVEMTIDNRTKREISAKQIVIVSDFDKRFLPLPNANLAALTRKIAPNTAEHITIVYEVDSDKRKYWLSLHDISGQKELSRIPVN